MPLVRGRYGTVNPTWSMQGQAANLTQSDIPPRSNADYLGMAGATDAAAALTTAVATTVAIPVQVGDVITRVSVRVGATAAGTPTNSWAALYSGITVPALLTQSVDGAAAAIAASGTFSFTLATPILVTPLNAPNGFMYVSLMVKATSVPSLASVSVATAIATPVFTGGAVLSQTNGSGLAATAPATVTGGTAQAVVPLVWLT